MIKKIRLSMFLTHNLLKCQMNSSLHACVCNCLMLPVLSVWDTYNGNDSMKENDDRRKRHALCHHVFVCRSHELCYNLVSVITTARVRKLSRIIQSLHDAFILQTYVMLDTTFH